MNFQRGNLFCEAFLGLLTLFFVKFSENWSYRRLGVVFRSINTYFSRASIKMFPMRTNIDTHLHNRSFKTISMKFAHFAAGSAERALKSS